MLIRKKALVCLLVVTMLILSLSSSAAASSVVTDSHSSSVLNRTMNFNVYLPPSYSTNTKQSYPVMYLLHGMYGSYRDWENMGMQSIVDSVNAKEMVIIMPDAGSSFYINGFEHGVNYEIYMHTELIPYVESKYRIETADGQNRAIAGLSMGGFGAAYHGFKYPDMFSSIYSMSGALTAPEVDVNLASVVDANNYPAYIMECGTEDFLVFDMNERFHRELQQLGVEHEYITRRGSHSAEFWQECLPKAIVFASENFSETNGQPDPDPDPDPDAPDSRSAFTTIQAEEYNSLNSSTIEIIGTGSSGSGIGYIESGDTVRYSNIDFEEGASEFTARLASDVSNTDMEIRLDSLYGTLLGTLSVGPTGGWNEYNELSTAISSVSGEHDLVLCFSGPVNLDWFTFSNGGDPEPEGSLGDVNDDGFINTNDYVLIRRHILGLDNVSSNADVDADGNINTVDYVYVKKYILGQISAFPGESENPEDPEIILPDFEDLQSNPRLPDPFTFLDGTPIRNISQWAHRRAEISALAQKFEYGEKPLAPDSLTATYSGNEIRITCREGSKSISFSCSIEYPSTGSAPYPAFIGVGMNTLNTSELLDLGVACITLPVDELAEQQGGGSRGRGKFYDLYGRNHSAGALMAWTWGASRLIDGLEVTPEANIDSTKLAVTGGSRYGKGALACGAFDERIALTVPQESGNGGASGWRTADAESQYREVQTLAQIIGENPWFSTSLNQFSGSTNKLPHDHHMVMALCAPRGLLVIENPDFNWLGPQSCYDTASTARIIFERLGIRDHFGYSSIGGHQHCQFPSSQQPELTAYIRKFLFDDNLVDTDVFRTDHNYYFDSSRWIDWTIPIL